MEYVISLILIIILVVILFKIGMRRITVFEYEKDLKYFKGKIMDILEP